MVVTAVVTAKTRHNMPCLMLTPILTAGGRRRETGRAAKDIAARHAKRLLTASEAVSMTGLSVCVMGQTWRDSCAGEPGCCRPGFTQSTILDLDVARFNS